MKNTLNNEYLDSFLDNIWAEQGLSKNTLLSYEHDIKSFLIFIQKKKIKIQNAQRSDVNSFISYRFSKGISSRSNKLKKLASLIVFWYHQLLSRITSLADHRLKETMKN